MQRQRRADVVSSVHRTAALQPAFLYHPRHAWQPGHRWLREQMLQALTNAYLPSGSLAINLISKSKPYSHLTPMKFEE